MRKEKNHRLSYVFEPHEGKRPTLDSHAKRLQTITEEDVGCICTKGKGGVRRGPLQPLKTKWYLLPWVYFFKSSLYRTLVTKGSQKADKVHKLTTGNSPDRQLRGPLRWPQIRVRSHAFHEQTLKSTLENKCTRQTPIGEVSKRDTSSLGLPSTSNLTNGSFHNHLSGVWRALRSRNVSYPTLNLR